MAILNRFNVEEIGHAIEVLVALLDLCDGDTDAEEIDAEDSFVLSELALGGNDGPGCAVSDGGDFAWVEWERLHSSKRRGPNIAGPNEDDEDDDPAGQYDEDCYTGPKLPTSPYDGAGCPISDPGGCEHDGREEEHDAESEQMGNDVPMLPVYSAEYNLFTDQRVFLGISNLQSSFRTNGGEVKSAETGAVLITHHDALSREPGVPV
jgi:hypothetical protein